MIRLSIIVGLLVLIACKTANEAPSALNTSLLTSTIVTVDPGKDTVITTAKGATISIEDGTFDRPVTLEIKEAYTMADMLLGGLVTESDGQLLQSDGMIYINTADKQAVKLNKPVKVSIPGSQPEMQLFKGEENSAGVVNWTQPAALNIVPDTPHAGRRLFWQACATCHGITKATVGPPLFGSMERAPDTASFYAFIRNNQAVLKSGNAYYRALFDQYLKMPMNVFPELTNKDIDQLMDYVNWAAKNAPNDTMQLPRTVDTAGSPQYDYMYMDSNNVPVMENDSLFLQYDTITEIPDSLYTQIMENSLRQGFTDQAQSDGAYTFEIKTLGWYNIDAYVQGLKGTELCELKVKLSDAPDQTDINVYLFVPKRKNLSVGVDYGNRIYHFEKWQNKIPLFPGDRSFILAFGNNKDEFYYGITGFTTKSQQLITVKLLKTTKEKFLEQVKALKFDGIQFDVK